MSSTQRSKARWGILRSALLGREFSESSRDASIHRYQGFQLLGKQHDASLPEASLDLICASDYLYYEILARQCHYGEEGSMNVRFSNSIRRTEVKNIREELARRGILAKFDDEHGTANIQWSFSSFTITMYTVCDIIDVYIR